MWGKDLTNIAKRAILPLYSPQPKELKCLAENVANGRSYNKQNYEMYDEENHARSCSLQSLLRCLVICYLVVVKYNFSISIAYFSHFFLTNYNGAGGQEVHY